MNPKMLIKIIGLESLLIFFYVLNGAFVSIKQPLSPFLQFALLIPFALGLFMYIAGKRNGEYISFILLKRIISSSPYHFFLF